jgi:hypothetical protein
VRPLPDIEPAARSRPERFFAAIDRGVRRVRPLRAILLWPVFTRPGYWFATGCAFVYGTVLRGRFQKRQGIHFFDRMPTGSYGRGGTTIGAIYLTTDNVSDEVLAHEAEHTAQWKRYGLWFIPLYIAAGSDAMTNRFEVGAGLELGGYLRKRPKRS